MPVPRITLGSLFHQSVIAFRTNFAQSFSIALVGHTVMLVFSWSLGTLHLMLDNSPPTHFDISLIAVYTVNFVIEMFLTGSIMFGVIQYLSGSKVTISQCMYAGLSVLFPLIVVSILAGVGIVFGSLLLLVPGLILMVMWSVVGPVTVAERPKDMTAGFRRSRDLTKGARWTIFVGFLCYLFIFAIFTVGIGYFSERFSLSVIPYTLFIIIKQSILLVVVVVLLSVLYSALSIAKDNTGIEEEA